MRLVQLDFVIMNQLERALQTPRISHNEDEFNSVINGMMEEWKRHPGEDEKHYLVEGQKALPEHRRRPVPNTAPFGKYMLAFKAARKEWMMEALNVMALLQQSGLKASDIKPIEVVTVVEKETISAEEAIANLSFGQLVDLGLHKLQAQQQGFQNTLLQQLRAIGENGTNVPISLTVRDVVKPQPIDHKAFLTPKEAKKKPYMMVWGTIGQQAQDAITFGHSKGYEVKVFTREDTTPKIHKDAALCFGLGRFMPPAVDALFKQVYGDKYYQVSSISEMKKLYNDISSNPGANHHKQPTYHKYDRPQV